MDRLFRNNFSCLHIYTFPTLDLETLIYLETDGYQTLLFLQIGIYWELLRHISAIDKKRFRPFLQYLAPPAEMLRPVSSAGGQAARADFPTLSSVATDLSAPEGNLGQDSCPRWPHLSFGTIPLLIAAASLHVLPRHWLYHLFKEEILKMGTTQLLDKRSLCFRHHHPKYTKADCTSVVSQDSRTFSHAPKKPFLVDQEIPCWIVPMVHLHQCATFLH